MPPKAAPMMTPTARSTTLPRNANFLNSSSISPPRCRRRSFLKNALVDQSGVHHGGADRGAGRRGDRNHGQTYGLVALAENRQRVFRRRRVGLEKQGLVQRHQLVLEPERAGIVALQ